MGAFISSIGTFVSGILPTIKYGFNIVSWIVDTLFCVKKINDFHRSKDPG